MEQVAETFKMLMNHMSPAEQEKMIELIRDKCEIDGNFMFYQDVEAVIDAIIDIYG